MDIREFDKLKRSYTAEDAFKIENGDYGQLLAIEGNTENFFSNLFSSISRFFNIKQHLIDGMKSDMKKDLMIAKLNSEKLIDKVDYSKVFESKIPVTMGFDTALYPIAMLVDENLLPLIDDAEEFIVEFDKELGRFITNEEYRKTFLVASEPKLVKKVDTVNNELNKLLNTKSRRGYSEVDTLLERKKGYVDILETVSNTFNSVDEDRYRTLLDKVRKSNKKLEALYDLLTVENEPVSKASLKSLVNKIEAVSNIVTTIGKLAFTGTELGGTMLKIERGFKEVI